MPDIHTLLPLLLEHDEHWTAARQRRQREKRKQQATQDGSACSEILVHSPELAWWMVRHVPPPPKVQRLSPNLERRPYLIPPIFVH